MARGESLYVSVPAPKTHLVAIFFEITKLLYFTGGQWRRQDCSDHLLTLRAGVGEDNKARLCLS